MRMKPGYGYWETTRYPIGGCFRRAPKTGNLLEVTDIEPLDKPYKGCTHSGRIEKETIAFDLDHLAPELFA